MTKKKPDGKEQMAAYSEAIKSGMYAKYTGLIGKYDNVRRYWEDELTRRYLRPHLLKLVRRTQSRVRRLRVMDLGCGGADGFELLSGMRREKADFKNWEIDVLTNEVLDKYLGVDLNGDLLDQARAYYGNNPKMDFRQADFGDGLPLEPNEKPYDLYFTSYGTFSHFNDDESLVKLLADIAKRTEEYCIIVGDWLGRWSYEWQTLWTHDLADLRNMDYVVSYIYPEPERRRRRKELQHLYLRLMSQDEVRVLAAEASSRAGVEIKPVCFFDRSVFTGRHMDTGDYNPYAQPVRAAVNALHEDYMRTDLSSLLVNYQPKAGFDDLNDYYGRLQMSWNTLVEYTAFLFDLYDRQQGKFRGELPAVSERYPAVLKRMLRRMKKVMEGVGWLEEGLPRENIIEPQLGYALRTLVAGMQQGQGGGHSLCAIFEVNKK